VARSWQDAAALEGIQGGLSGSVDVELLVDDEHMAVESMPGSGTIFGATKECEDSSISGVVGLSVREVPPGPGKADVAGVALPLVNRTPALHRALTTGQRGFIESR
jgi:hypothetical protein